MSRVFRKTPKGVEAFANKESGLSHAHRALLVLVDGKRNASQLRKFGASFGNVNGLLGELFNSGLIELDPAYVAKMTAVQAEIAQENAALPSALAVETVVAGSSNRPPLPSLNDGVLTPMGSSRLGAPNTRGGEPRTIGSNPPTQSKPPKRDLRELALLAEPDPVVPAADSPTDAAKFKAGKAFAIEFVRASLGNSGMPLRFALERTDSLPRLKEVAEIAANTLRDMRGSTVAADFRRGFEGTVASS